MISVGDGHFVVHPQRGSSFLLPAEHGVAIDDRSGYITLTMPGGGTVYELVEIAETESTVAVSLGPEVTHWKEGYRLPGCRRPA